MPAPGTLRISVAADPTAELGRLYRLVRKVADAKVAFEVMAGPDPRDPHSVPLLDVPPPAQPRVAVSPRLGLDVAVDAGAIPSHAVADPLDRWLVATARRHDVPLVTCDRALLAYAASSRQVTVIDGRK